jgi:hypothetical protein
MDAKSKAARSALGPVLEAGEGVERVAPAVGCTLVLTDRRLFLVREGGARRRPASGIQSWRLDGELTIRIGKPIHDSSLLLIGRAGCSASVFLTGANLGNARLLIAEAGKRADTDG